MTRPRGGGSSTVPPNASGSASEDGPGQRRPTGDGHGRSSTSAARLVDTNVLVYRFDPRFPEKQRLATELLGRGISDDTVRVPHQAILEFVAVVTRPTASGARLLEPAEARRE